MGNSCPDLRRYFRNQLREARAAAEKDAEGFQEIVFTLERMASYLYDQSEKAVSDGTENEKLGLAAYKDVVCELARTSPLAHPGGGRMPFGELYDVVREGRNDKMHQGAAARSLTRNAVNLALVLEDALMSGQKKDSVTNYMVENPVCACPWQPLSFIRFTMLANSFSHLPFFVGKNTQGPGPGWHFVSEHGLARFLRKCDTRERRRRLNLQLSTACAERLATTPADTVGPDSTIEDVFRKQENCRQPVLVVKDADALVGIITSFDLL